MKKFLQLVLTLTVFTALTIVTTNAIAQSLSVTTNNHTARTYSATESISGGGNANFTLNPEASVMKQIPEPSSGTATLSAYFVNASSTIAFNCSQNYHVNSASAAVVAVYVSSGSDICAIGIQ